MYVWVIALWLHESHDKLNSQRLNSTFHHSASSFGAAPFEKFQKMLSLAFEANIPSLVLLLPINHFAFSVIGTCIGVVLSIRTSENATLTTWLILRMVELLNIIFEVIIGVIVYCYISTTEGFVVLGFSTFHTICEIYAWNITKSMYFKESFQNKGTLAVVNPFNEDNV